MFEEIKYKNDNLNRYVDGMISLLDYLSMKNFEMPTIMNYKHVWLTITPGIDSSIKTLKGIKELVGIGDFIDAYVLIRKLRDNLIFDCVIAQDSENNTPIINDNFIKTFLDSNGNVDEERFKEAMDSFICTNLIYESINEDKDRLEQWRLNKTHHIGDDEDEWIGYSSFRRWLEKDNRHIKTINRFYLKQRMVSLQKETNAYVHTLHFNNSINSVITCEENTNKIMFHLQTIKMMLISYLMVIKSRLFGNTDLFDNGSFKEGEQYLIPPGIIDELKEIKAIDSELYKFLEKNNSDSMLFEKGLDI